MSKAVFAYLSSKITDLASHCPKSHVSQSSDHNIRGHQDAGSSAPCRIEL